MPNLNGILKGVQQQLPKIAKKPNIAAKGTKIAPKTASKTTKYSTKPNYIDPFLDTTLKGKIGRNILKLPGMKQAASLATKSGKITSTGFRWGGWLAKLGILSGVTVGGGVIGSLIGQTIANMMPVTVIALRTIDRFDWMKSDKTIEEEIKNSFKQIYSRAGTAAGVSLAWLVVSLNGLIIMKVNPNVAAQMFGRIDPVTKKFEKGNFSEEASQEILSALSSAAWAVYQAYSYNFLAKKFMQMRKFMLANPDHPSSVYVRKNILGEEGWKNWGKENQQPISISKNREERINKIPDENWKAFWTQFNESFSDSLLEAAVTFQASHNSAAESLQMMRQQKSRTLTVLSRVAQGAITRTRLV